MGCAQELDGLEHTVGVLALDDRAIVSVHGDDSRDWLQGQVTNQIEGAEPGDSVYAFVLTLKGRILVDAYVLIGEDEIWLDVPRSQVDALLSRFDRYIIMEDVEVEHRPDLGVLVAVGPRAKDVADGGWPSDRLGVGGRQWVVPVTDLGTTFERLRKRSIELEGAWISPGTWAYAHVVRGRPRFGIDFGDWTYPQESGLSPIAVSFNKGCYIGQETVVMLQNRGKAPKTLWRWALAGSEAPAAGTPIHAQGQVVGELTSAAARERDVRALGFLKRGFEPADPGGFEVGGSSVRALGPVEDGPGVCAGTT